MLISLFVYPQAGNNGSSNTDKTYNPIPCASSYGYVDLDTDGFGSGFSTCIDTLIDLGQPYSSIGGDCNDNDPLINPNTIWYYDGDLDGFGTNNNLSHPQIKSCIKPNHYSFYNTDCNDSNSSINPTTIWYYDGDNDGYGASNANFQPITQCSSPNIHYVSNNSDCDDSNSSVYSLLIWYYDTDADGFGESQTAPSCYQPPNTVNNNLDLCPGIAGSFQGCVIPQNSSINSLFDQNYVLSISPKVAVNDLNQLISSDDLKMGITYYDGLSRPIQQISSKSSSTGNDVVVPIEYDISGRQEKEYLPYTANTNLNFDNNALLNVSSFYTTPSVLNTGGNESTSYPYSQKVYETFSGGKLLNQFSQGNNWGLNSVITDHSVKFDYQTNISNEVRKYKVVYDSEYGHHIESDGFYIQNQLFKSIVKNENWVVSDNHNNTTQEFKDKDGKIILIRKFSHDIVPNSSPVAYADLVYNTYYLYDDLNNLSYVIPPIGSDSIDSIFGTSTTTNKNYPWTTIVNVDGSLAEEYNKLFSEYKNQFVLNTDLFNKYGGEGGFSIVTNEDNSLILNININTVKPFELKKGSIVSLKELGRFKDVELGRVSGEGYEYIFYVKENTLMIEGGGMISSLNLNLIGDTKLVYNNNYSWASLFNIKDPKEEEQYLTFYNKIKNEDVLSTNFENQYGARGGINISIDSNDNVSINLNLASEVPLSLKTGIVIPLKTERRISDREIMTISGEGYKYILKIKENSIFIDGDGEFILASNTALSIPPPVIDIPNDIIEGLCYEYNYDNKNRLIEKKIPGKGWEYFVYDKINRPVLSQDSNLSLQNKWLFKKYDVFDRPIYTGQFEYISALGNMDSSLRDEIQTLVDANVNLDENRTSTSFQNNGININYTNSIFPNLLNTNFTVFTVNYYDDYDFQPFNSPITVPSSVYSSTPNIQTTLKSLPTANLINILDSQDWISNITAYDKKNRPVWVKSSNSKFNTVTITESSLDFIGKTNESKTTHLKNGLTTLTFINQFTYDNADRLLKQTQKINSNNEELIFFNKYSELGKLIKKKVGGLAPSSSLDFDNVLTSLQTIDYEYNVKGWLKKMNDPNLFLTNNLFAFSVNYDNPQLGGTPNFNGNISEMSWTSKQDNKKRNYLYSYDSLNRLTQADYVGNYPIFMSPKEDFSEGNISYDKNGNISHLERYGLKSNNTNIDIIDNLNYFYNARSNKLKKIDDTSLESNGFKDIAGDDYDYDINGNMIKDLNKDITQIFYNHLNLPVKIVFNNADPDFTSHPNAIEFIYDANGRKVAKIILKSNLNGGIWTTTNTTTNYDNGFIYENNILQFFSQPEGYVSYDSSNGYNYIYQFKDYLGNIRLSYKKNSSGVLDIIEENNYYPFGLKHQGYNAVYNPIGNDLAQKYRYNSKEWQNELGLNMYDYGSRLYDPARAGWSNVDPLAEKMRRWSPYCYAFDNPMRFIDPDGCAPTDWYRNNVTGAIAWRDGSAKIEGYSNLGYSWGYTDINNNRTQLDGDTKLITYNGDIRADFNNKESGSLIKSGFTIWGKDRSGDTTGLHGITTDSTTSDLIPHIGGTAEIAGEISALGKLATLISNFCKGFGWADGVKDRVETIVETTKEANKEETKAEAKDSVRTTYYDSKGNETKSEIRVKKDNE